MARQSYHPSEFDSWWPKLLTMLPADLDELAAQTGALQRCRQIPNGAVLTRLLLGFAASDMSLKTFAGMSALMGAAKLSAPGFFYRLKHSGDFLAALIARQLPSIKNDSNWRVLLTDASVVSGPGAEGTDWRVHLLYEPGSDGISQVQLTDHHGGESFRRWQTSPNDLVLGDRGYGHARGIHSLQLQGAQVLVRVNPESVRFYDLERRRVMPADWRDQVPKMGVVEWNLLMPVPPERRSKTHKPWALDQAQAWLPVRLIAARTPKGGIIWLLTTASAADLPGWRAMELYRLRWQIELFFKRLKTLLWLDRLPAKPGPTARSWILAKLLTAILAQSLTLPNSGFSPWGYDPRGWARHGCSMAQIPCGDLADSGDSS